MTYIFRENLSRSKCLRSRRLAFSICNGYIIAKQSMVVTKKEITCKFNMRIFVVKLNLMVKNQMATYLRMASTSFMSTKVIFLHFSKSSIFSKDATGMDALAYRQTNAPTITCNGKVISVRKFQCFGNMVKSLS